MNLTLKDIELRSKKYINEIEELKKKNSDLEEQLKVYFEEEILLAINNPK